VAPTILAPNGKREGLEHKRPGITVKETDLGGEGLQRNSYGEGKKKINHYVQSRKNEKGRAPKCNVSMGWDSKLGVSERPKQTRLKDGEEKINHTWGRRQDGSVKQDDELVRVEPRKVH